MAEHVRVMLSEEAVDKRIQQIGEDILIAWEVEACLRES